MASTADSIIIEIFTVEGELDKGRSRSKKKKKGEISHLGGGVRTKLGHFHTFLFFFLSCPK